MRIIIPDRFLAIRAIRCIQSSKAMDTSSPDSQALPQGTHLHEFVIERVLGSGGFGITYLARDTSLNRPVVIKENLPVQFCIRDTHSLTVAPRHTHGGDADNFQWSLENFSGSSEKSVGRLWFGKISKCMI
jgi:hypothetical protein